ncbi:hypothetical protein JHK87_052885 [Glycine soja]|nr:hypothetical protein JHK87_052885 [Glycine soja]
MAPQLSILFHDCGCDLCGSHSPQLLTFVDMFSLLCAIYAFVQPKRFDLLVVVPVFDYFAFLCATRKVRSFWGDCCVPLFVDRFMYDLRVCVFFFLF